MHTVFALLLLMSSTVDPRLADPLRILTTLVAQDGKHIGAEYQQIVSGSTITLVAVDLPPGRLGRYTIATRTVMISESVLAEDPRLVATVLAHELRHVDDTDLAALGLLSADCVELEARAFASQAVVARALWPDELPRSTEFERQLTMLVLQYEHEGLPGLRATLRQDAAYRGLCAAG